MTRLKMPQWKWLLGFAVTGAAPVLAQSQQPTPIPTGAPETLSLTPEEKADIVAHQTEASVDAARAGLAGGGAAQIHGEIGTMVGTHGAREVYGTAAIPLGANAGMTVSFERSHDVPHY